jgi:hypothetical protein
MMRHAQDLGASQEEVIQLLEDVNNYWESPMNEERLDKLKDQGQRLF